MCTTFEVLLQVKKGEEWETLDEITIPTDDMPLCGCWLFHKEEDWLRIEEAHRRAGNIDKLPQTKEQAKKLQEMFKERLYEFLSKLEPYYSDQRVLIERIV